MQRRSCAMCDKGTPNWYGRGLDTEGYCGKWAEQGGKVCTVNTAMWGADGCAFCKYGYTLTSNGGVCAGYEGDGLADGTPCDSSNLVGIGGCRWCMRPNLFNRQRDLTYSAWYFQADSRQTPNKNGQIYCGPEPRNVPRGTKCVVGESCKLCQVTPGGGCGFLNLFGCSNGDSTKCG
jgi:hypothetical protein